MLKKAASVVLAVVSDLRAHKLGPFRAVSAPYWEYTPRLNTAVALLGDFFDHSRQLLTTQLLAALTSDL